MPNHVTNIMTVNGPAEASAGRLMTRMMTSKPLHFFNL